MQRLRFFKQLNKMDCGPTCLRMIARYYGKHITTEKLRQMAGFNRSGVSLLGISEIGEKIGFRTRGAKLTFNQLQQVQLPCILHLNQNHFVVLKNIKKRKVSQAHGDTRIICQRGVAERNNKKV